jgi:hypothetical protein
MLGSQVFRQCLEFKREVVVSVFLIDGHFWYVWLTKEVILQFTVLFAVLLL